MSTRSTRRGNVITAEDLCQFKQPKKSTKGSHKNKPDTEPEKTSKIPTKKSKNVLTEQNDNEEIPLPEKRRATRSAKPASDENDAYNVNIQQKPKGKKNKQKEIPDPVLEPEDSTKENIVERKSRRGKKNTGNVENDIVLVDMNKEQVKAKKQYSKKSKKITKEVDNDENDKSIGEIVVVAPSKRGSTEKCLNIKPSKSRRTRGAAKTENAEKSPVKNIKVTKKVKNKRNIQEKVINESNNSNMTDDTSYHSVQESPTEIIKDRCDEKVSLNDTFIVESEESKKSTGSDTLNVTYELLDSTKSSTEDKVEEPKSIQKLVSSIEAKTRSRRNLRISGIEEICPPVNTTLSKDATFIKDSENETSINVSKNKFSAASPCRIFSNSKPNSGFNNLKNDSFKTPPKVFCSAISFGSAGRTPMPPPKPSTPEKSDDTHKKSTGFRKSVVLNLTRSLEKAEKAMSAAAVESTVGKNRVKVTFCSPNRQAASVIPLASKIVKSSLKGSDKSFTSTNSVTKPVLRKRSLTQSDADQRSQKLIKLSYKSLNTSMNRHNKPKTPMSDAKQGLLRPRGQMPDFSSIHKKQFDQMESLVQHKARKEARAKLFILGTPGNTTLKALNNTVTVDTPKVKDPATRTPCFTRFGFKLKTSPSKEAPKWSAPQFKFKATPGKEKKEVAKWTAPQFKPKSPVKETKEAPKWSAAQFKAKTTKAQARSAILRDDTDNVVEKKRAANRDYVKGVRTNRRFELQMKSRNIVI